MLVTQALRRCETDETRVLRQWIVPHENMESSEVHQNAAGYTAAPTTEPVAAGSSAMLATAALEQQQRRPLRERKDSLVHQGSFGIYMAYKIAKLQDQASWRVMQKAVFVEPRMLYSWC